MVSCLAQNQPKGWGVVGVAQEVVSPTDGLVGELLVEAGTAVEYGQELIVVALTAPAEAAR